MRELGLPFVLGCRRLRERDRHKRRWQFIAGPVILKPGLDLSYACGPQPSRDRLPADTANGSNIKQKVPMTLTAFVLLIS